MRIIPEDQEAEVDKLLRRLDELSKEGGYGLVLIMANMHDMAWVKNIPEEFLLPLAKRWLNTLENPQEALIPVIMTRGGSS